MFIQYLQIFVEGGGGGGWLQLVWSQESTINFDALKEQENQEEVLQANVHAQVFDIWKNRIVLLSASLNFP